MLLPMVCSASGVGTSRYITIDSLSRHRFTSESEQFQFFNVSLIYITKVRGERKPPDNGLGNAQFKRPNPKLVTWSIVSICEYSSRVLSGSSMEDAMGRSQTVELDN